MRSLPSPWTCPLWILAAALGGCSLGESVDADIGRVPDDLRGYCVATYPQATEMGFFTAPAGGEFLMSFGPDDDHPDGRYALKVVSDCGAVDIPIEARDETFESACAGRSVVHDVVAVVDAPVYEDLHVGQPVCTIPRGAAVPLDAFAEGSLYRGNLNPVQVSAEIDLRPFQAWCPGRSRGVLRGTWVDVGDAPLMCFPLASLMREAR